MPSFQTAHRVRHSAAEMFDLVADVEAYPQFVPLCRSLRVRRRTEDNGVATLIANMEVGYKAIHETFTSRVTCNRERLVILVEYIDGPFKHLENRWAFRQQGAGQGDDQSCIVDFGINYEFRSRALSLLMGGMFDAAFRKFATAFEQRADIVYGAAI
ncbi:type II toxin-antitoxin system RatA family toxin [Methylocapsa palsarum]|uniref:Coenzyme Q-binding protein COQ10 n=1 Tax=Methylocapsa palsarum TaxID=1612308 RepID=A0A1I3YAD0_9HYPH|nr:type II toxin-antitoxin system RatA family toxin [Methylocapsa palsarum]SFK28211.1 coenzyme Q-binding protein COQ10 [Methylocapsa palsarum]